MFKIIGKENGVIWDTINNKPLIKFKKGVAVTKDKEVAEQLKTMGFIVENETQNNQVENETQDNQTEDEKNETQDNQIEDEKNEIKDSQTNDKKEKSKKK